jgi:hypothetical protein
MMNRGIPFYLEKHMQITTSHFICVHSECVALHLASSLQLLLWFHMPHYGSHKSATCFFALDLHSGAESLAHL